MVFEEIAGGAQVTHLSEVFLLWRKGHKCHFAPKWGGHTGDTAKKQVELLGSWPSVR